MGAGLLARRGEGEGELAGVVEGGAFALRGQSAEGEADHVFADVAVEAAELGPEFVVGGGAGGLTPAFQGAAEFGTVAGNFADVVAEGVEFGGDLGVEVGDLAFVGGEEGGGHGVEWGIN